MTPHVHAAGTGTLGVGLGAVGVPDAALAEAVVRPGGIDRLAEQIRDVSGAGAGAAVAPGPGPGARARARAAIVVLGADRFTATGAGGSRVDPSTAVLALGRALPDHAFLVAVAPTRDHPYNVARRVLSLDHVLDGRVGLVVGARDHGVTAPDEVHDPAEFARVVLGLWTTWPLESIVGDRERGVFADTDQIRPLDHDGGPDGYRVRGPLTTPSSVRGTPTLAVWEDVHLPEADLVLSASSLTALPGRAS